MEYPAPVGTTEPAYPPGLCCKACYLSVGFSLATRKRHALSPKRQSLSRFSLYCVRLYQRSCGQVSDWQVDFPAGRCGLAPSRPHSTRQPHVLSVFANGSPQNPAPNTVPLTRMGTIDGQVWQIDARRTATGSGTCWHEIHRAAPVTPAHARPMRLIKPKPPLSRRVGDHTSESNARSFVRANER